MHKSIRIREEYMKKIPDWDKIFKAFNCVGHQQIRNAISSPARCKSLAKKLQDKGILDIINKKQGQ